MTETLIHSNARYKCMKIYLSIVFFGALFFHLHAQELGSKLTQQQAQEALNIHNEAREQVGVQELVWSAELAQFAQQWADHLAKNGCEMEHSGGATGENLYWTSHAVNSSPSDAVHAWYSEKKEFKNQPISMGKLHKTGHYSQMVWKSTTHVGIAMAKCSTGGAIVVANYNPPGNYLGERAY